MPVSALSRRIGLLNDVRICYFQACGNDIPSFHKPIEGPMHTAVRFRTAAFILVGLFAGIDLSTAQNLPKKTHSHEITLDSAKKYIGNLKKDAMQMKTKGGMFTRDVLDKMLSQKGAIGIRYYYAKMDDGTPTIVLIAVDSTGKNITNGVIAEKTYPCPPYCNTDDIISD